MASPSNEAPKSPAKGSTALPELPGKSSSAVAVAPLPPARTTPLQKTSVPSSDPAPATDRTDAPLISSGSPASKEEPVNAMGMPSTMKVVDKLGNVSTVQLMEGAEKASLCCGIPAPPGGWWGPFGFFRLVSYAFAACAVLGLILALMGATGGPFAGVPLIGGQPDGFAAMASLLLVFASLLCGLAAYAHEGLANEVTAMKKQNDIFAEKNDKLEAQLGQLGKVGDRLEEINKSMGVHLDELQDTLRSLHQVNCTTQMSTVLRAFIDADSGGYGNKDARLEKDELSDFFDSCRTDLKEAAPDFDLQKLENEALPVGIGIFAMRFILNAVVAGCDEVPGRSTAMLTLLLFSFNPEEHCDELAVALKPVMKSKTSEEIAAILAAKKKQADPKEHGRIPGHELSDVAREVMANAPDQKGSGQVK